MKHTPINKIPNALPSEIDKLCVGAKVFDSSSSPEARVYFIEKECGYYLKKGAKGALRTEADMTKYFHSKGLGTEVLAYVSEEFDWLLTTKVVGYDCTHPKYIENPKRLCDTVANELRALHELDFGECPVMERNRDYLATAEKNYKLGKFDTSLFGEGRYSFSSADEAYHTLSKGASSFSREVLLHGDYCLPNIILDDWRLSAFIDLGCGGIGDRHIDIFWGTWTLLYNLKTDKYRERFLDAYGRDKINTDMLRVVAAAEVFG